MFHINDNFLKLQGSYLFSTIAKKVAAYQEENPDTRIIRLGIGDVTLPLVPAVIEGLHQAVDEMGDAASFRGYAPEQGYDFLRRVIAEKDFKARGCRIEADEIFISDGAKCDSGNIQEMFALGCKIALCDPVYPVYLDSNVMAGRSGAYDPKTGRYEGIIYMPCLEENGFVPEFPRETPDVIYLCFPNNPTGEVITKEVLQDWVDYANKNGSVIIYDAAYEAYITDNSIPHTIYECEGARTCAIELRSFSKKAGFTGVRLAYTVVPGELRRNGTALKDLWNRRQCTKYNGAPYIVQKAGEAVYSPEGESQIKEQISYYMRNAETIRKGMKEAGFTAYGGVNSPYIWMKTPKGMSSWEFFDCLLERAHVVGTPGCGFGPAGEGFFRLTAFGNYENTLEALDQIQKM
ncbi:LL-diaminopimelate aminotransferase [Lachnospiraceae bacterium 62-35]